MAPEQDAHRNKRARTIDGTEHGSTLLATHLASRRNAQLRPLTIPRDPASNNPFAPQTHDSRSRASPDLINDIVDASSSRGNGVALPFRDRGKGALQADTIPSVNEDVEMRDAASISTENAGGKVVVSENGLQHGGDGTIDRSSSKGKGTALSTSEELRPRGVIEAGDRSNPVTQNVAQSTEMASSGNEYRNDEDHKDEDNGGDGIKGRYGKFHQVYPAKMVNPPVQEVHVTEDGTLEVRPEVVSVTGSGKK